MTQEEHEDLLLRQETNFDGEKFEVQGAGFILISDSIGFLCGDANGFDFGVSWGRGGYIGGVLDRKEAIRLAEFILEKVAE